MAQQFQMPGSFDQQQMQHMMMAMAAAAAGNAGTAPGMAGGLGMPFPPPGAGSPQASLPQAMSSDGSSSVPFPPGGVDPAMAHAYAQMFTQYLQQAQAYACGSDHTSMGSTMGVPPPPFPSMGTPYTPATPMAPVVAVSVDGMKFQYQLTEDDLHKVFSRYGTVKHIHVDEAGTTAQITFQEFHHAQAAMTDLNGKVLNGLDGTLRLVWASQGPAALPPPYSMMPPFPSWGFPTPGTAPWAGAALPSTAPAAGVPSVSTAGDLANMLAMGGPAMGAPPSADPGTTVQAVDGTSLAGAAASTAALADNKAAAAPAHVKGVRKYTCRFLIGIENDKEFQVVRRIIGAKGTNMKRIVRQTEAKLRLRGVGSGYFEGAGHRESSEPLQLCVSCTSPEGYRTAVRLVEELLENVYGEYRQFCRDNGRPEPDLHASPQLVSAGGRGGGAGGGGGPSESAIAGAGVGGAVASAAAANAASASAGDSDAAGEGESPSSKRDGRRRGRRSRAKKGEAGKPGVERGDPPSKAPPVDEIERLIDQRNEARRQCNFTEADRIRQSLHEKGVALMDEPGARGKGAEVTTWRYWRE